MSLDKGDFEQIIQVLKDNLKIKVVRDDHDEYSNYEIQLLLFNEKISEDSITIWD